MIFDTHFLLFSLFWAAIGAGVTTALTWAPEDQARTKHTAIWTFVLVFLALRTMLYYYMPVFQGSFFGYFEVLLVTLGIASAVAFVRGKLIKGAIYYCFLAAVTLLVVPVFLFVFNANWGKANSKLFASLPNITIAKTTDTMPPTDPSHMVLVPRSVAVFKGGQKLIGDISSRFKVDEASYTLQSVAGHRYWIAPLTLISLGDTINFSASESPGYVVVDAEDPDADSDLKTGFHIKLFSDQQWALWVKRHAYQHGYSDAVLSTPFFEVDDQWQPYWTFGYMKKPFGGMQGLVLDKIVMVNVAQEEPDMQVANPKDRPDWLDRAIEPSMIETYANDWGWFGRGKASDYWSIFWKWNREGTLQPAEIELNYTTDSDNVYVVPMTGTTGAHAVQGVLVFETNRNEAIYYPGLNNFFIGDSVGQTMYGVKENVMHYAVESVQLYSIYGELTWVGIYVAPQANGGKSFAGVGILHAHSQNPADVIFSTSKNTALSRYASQLAAKRQTGQLVSKSADPSKQVSAVIGRINFLPSSTQPTYLFVVPGDEHTYRITLDAYPRIPLVQAGDSVSFSYLDSKEPEQAVSTFQCVKCPGMEIHTDSTAGEKASATAVNSANTPTSASAASEKE